MKINYFDLLVMKIVVLNLKKILKDMKLFTVFLKFFTKDCINHIVKNTNKYVKAKFGGNDKIWYDTTYDEITDFLGLYLLIDYMFFTHVLPSIEDYWTEDLKVKDIADCIKKNIFQQLRYTLHGVDNFTYDKYSNKDRFYIILITYSSRDQTDTPDNIHKDKRT